MFLTQDEVKSLTGYELPGWQRRWLDSHQWIYTCAANGRIVVSKAYAESKLSGVAQKKEPVMNLAGLRKRA